MNIQNILERIKNEEVIEEFLIRKLCKCIQEVFMGESNLEPVSSPIILVGDVHGQFYDVLKLLSIGRSVSIQLDNPHKPNTSSSEISSIVVITHSKPSCSYSV